MQLNELNGFSTGRSAKRVGRGIGSGKGKTSGRGHKGQKSRAGATIKGFEGGQMPIHRRLPKRGFTNIFRIENQVVTLDTLQLFIDNKKLDASKVISNQSLFDAGVIKKKNQPVKILAKGVLKAAVKLEIDAASKAAIAAVEKAKGSVKLTKKEEKAAEPKDNSKKASAKEAPKAKQESEAKKAPAKAKKETKDDTKK